MLTAKIVQDIAKDILKVSQEIDQDRTSISVALALVSEAGELAEEVRIKHHPFHKSAGKDGIIGEAADVLIAATDYAHVLGESGVLTNDDLFFVEENEEIVEEVVLGWTSEAISWNDENSKSEEAMCDITIGAGKALAVRGAARNGLTTHTFVVLNDVINGLILLSKCEDFDVAEFTEIVTDKLEKWKTNYSK